MIDHVKPYPAMKNSGVPWLGEVPEHWKVAALRHRYSQVLGKMLDAKRIVGKSLLPYLRNTDVQWDQINVDGLPQMDIAPAEYDRYTVREGDLLVCEGGEVGRAAIWAGELPLCGFQKALHRLRPFNPDSDVPRFLYFALRTAAKSDAFGDGHVSTIAHLTGDKLRAHPFTFPPADEQTAIVRFLDHADRRIWRYIRAKQKLIKLLEEQKQAIIHRAVTRGLDTNVRLKPSGVEWLGEVPEHWEVRRMKRVATLNPSKSEAYGALKTGAPATFLPMSRVGADGRVDAREIHAAAALWNGFMYFRRGDVLVAKITPCFENGKGACLDTLPTEIGFGSTEFIVARATDCLLPRFLYRVTTLAEFRRLGADAMIGAAGQQRVPTSFVADFHIPLPSLDEQAAIVRFLDREVSSLAKGIEHAHREVSLLREYRTRLIADVVTGKLDVREAAARLPQEAEDLEPLDEADVESNAEETDAGNGDAVPEEAEA